MSAFIIYSPGNIYRQSIMQNDLMVKQAEDIKEFTMAFIRRMEEN